MDSRPSARSVARRALRTVRRHWRALLVIATVIFVPLALLDVADHHVGELALQDLSTAHALEALGIGLSHSVTALLGEIFFAGVVAAAVQETHGGKAPTVRELLRSLPFGTLIAIDILVSLGVGVGLVLLIVPGVLFFGYFALTAPLAKIEHLGVRAAFRRSRGIVRGHLGFVLGILVPVVIAGELLASLLVIGASEVLGENLPSEFLGAFLSEAIATPLWAFAAVSLTYELLEHERSGGHDPDANS